MRPKWKVWGTPLGTSTTQKPMKHHGAGIVQGVADAVGDEAGQAVRSEAVPQRTRFVLPSPPPRPQVSSLPSPLPCLQWETNVSITAAIRERETQNVRSCS